MPIMSVAICQQQKNVGQQKPYSRTTKKGKDQKQKKYSTVLTETRSHKTSRNHEKLNKYSSDFQLSLEIKLDMDQIWKMRKNVQV